MLLAALLCAGAARAGPPLTSDDPATIAPGSFELNAAVTARLRGSSDAVEAPLLDLTYGLVEDVEIFAALPWIVKHDPGSNTKSDLGGLTLGTKWRFFETDGRDLAAAIAPSVSLRTQTSSDLRDVATTDTTVTIPLDVEKRFDRWRVGAELGYAVVVDGKDEWLTGVWTGVPLGPRAELLAELYAVTTRRFSDSELTARIGADVTLRPNLHLLISVGRALHETTGDRLDFGGYAGLQLFF